MSAAALPAGDERARSLSIARGLATLLMAASGFAALGYEIVWTQQNAVWTGHESAAMLAVVAAFFGGTALGAVVLSDIVERSANAARLYACCEAIIGLWAVVLAFVHDRGAAVLLELIGPTPSPAWHWCVAFAGTFVLLLPATAAMGATLPAAERIFCGVRRRGAALAPLYAANTAGAVIGVLVAALWLVPTFGLRATAFVCAALSLVAAAAATLLYDDGRSAANAATTRGVRRDRLAYLFATGLLGIGYEVVVVRVLAQVTESTVYTFALVLATYLVGTALGAALYPALRKRRTHDVQSLQDGLLLALAISCIASGALLAFASPIAEWLVTHGRESLVTALLGEAFLAGAAFLVPTIFMGLLFSHIATVAREDGMSLGRAFAVNTAGAAFAPAVFGVLLVPAIGLGATLILIAIAYLFLRSRRTWLERSTIATAIATVVAAAWLPAPGAAHLAPGERTRTHVEGAMASVTIIEDARGVRRLHVNNRPAEGTNATWFADARQAWLPLLLHPAPHRALFLGLGTGVTARSATEHAGVDVTAVELLPEVIAASRDFLPARSGQAPLRIIAADARRFVRATPERFDVIVADNYHPARSGSGALYTVEHYAAIRERLAPGGVFCQWLPLHQLDRTTLAMIVRAFIQTYPRSFAILATHSLDTPVIGLVARGDEAFLELDTSTLRDGGAASVLARVGLRNPVEVLGTFIAGPKTLARFAAEAPLNTDDHPAVAYRAPLHAYLATSSPRDDLVALLREMSIAPAELLGNDSDAAFARRLQAYWKARDLFIAAGRDVKPVSDPRRMLTQVRDPLLDVLRHSPEFRPAYEPLYRLALALRRDDPAAAQELLGTLESIASRAPR